MKIFSMRSVVLFVLTLLVFNISGCSGSSSSSSGSSIVYGKDPYSVTNYTSDDVARLYIGTYNKPLSYTVMDGLIELKSIGDIIDQLNPNKTIYPDNSSYRTFVATLYENTFSREGLDTEIQVWVTRLENREILRKNMWWEFAKSATGIDLITMNNKLEVSKYYADTNKMGDFSLIEVTDDYQTVETAKAKIDKLPLAELPIPDPTQSLTNNEDHISIDYGYDMSGDDIIEGKILNGADTLQTFDGIDGGTGYNIVRATVINGSSATYRNIDEVQFRFAGEDDDSNISLENDYTGIDIVSVIYSNVGGAVTHVGNIDDFRVIRTSQDATFRDGTAGAIELTVDLTYNYSKLVDINFEDSRIGYLNLITKYSGFTFDQSQDDGDDDTEDTVSTLGETDIALTGANSIAFDAGETSLQTIRATGEGSLDLTPKALKALVSIETGSDVEFLKLHVDNTDAASIEKIDATNGRDFIRIDAGDQHLKGNLQVIADSGDDYVIITAQDGAMIETGAQIDGDRGIDVIGLNSAIVVSLKQTKDENSFDNFEVLHILDELDGNADTKITEMNYIDEIQNVWLLDTYKNENDDDDDDDTDDSDDDGIDGDDDDVHVVINGLENNANITLTQKHEGGDDEDAGDILVLIGHNTDTGVDDTYNIYLDNTFNNLNSDVDYGNITVDYVENLNFVANNGFVLDLNISSANSARTVNSSGTSLLNLIPENDTSNPISTVTTVRGGDGGIRINIAKCTNNQSVITGSGNDVIFLGDTDGEDGSVNEADLGAGYDYLTGGDGIDEVDLGSGNDVYYSSPGKDVIIFGTGRDSYIARESTHSNGTQRDIIKDFVRNEDLFNFSNIIADQGEDDDKCYNNSTKAGNEGPCYLGEVDGWDEVLSSLSGHVGETVLDNDSDKVFIDVNGDADIDDNDMVIKVEGVKDLSPNDFKYQ